MIREPISSTLPPIRIAIIRRHYRPDGGAERSLKRTLEALRDEADLDISLITQVWRDGPEPGFRLIEVGKPGWTRAGKHKRFVRAVQAVMQRERFDLVQSNERVPGCQIFRAGDGVHRQWLALRARQGDALARWSWRVSGFHREVLAAEKALFAHPDLRRVICISDMVRNDVLEHYPQTDPGLLKVIYNGIDLDRFAPSSRPPADRYTELGLDPAAPTALFVGSGFARKGLAALLEALVEAAGGWQLIVVGRDKHLPAYRRQAARLGLARRVHFAGVQTHVQPWYALADVVVHPAEYEPFGNVILEAMASGRGVIASTRCGGAELIESGVNGVRVPPGDVAAIAAALSSCADRARLSAFGLAARRTAESFPLSRLRDEMLGLYREVLDEVRAL
ncbi:MAG: glycosyltransferase family 4 protein [Gammaproteobacteria bacterium]|nr:glycosyltransferase family 4 protein [Gammaproteobacteria bacterium]